MIIRLFFCLWFVQDETSGQTVYFNEKLSYARESPGHPSSPRYVWCIGVHLHWILINRQCFWWGCSGRLVVFVYVASAATVWFTYVYFVVSSPTTAACNDKGRIPFDTDTCHIVMVVWQSRSFIYNMIAWRSLVVCARLIVHWKTYISM